MRKFLIGLAVGLSLSVGSILVSGCYCTVSSVCLFTNWTTSSLSG